MDLLRFAKESEYRELQMTLLGMGFYEEGMELQEMRDVLTALQKSASEAADDDGFSQSDMQQAIRESESDFSPSQRSSVLNSTMLSSRKSTSKKRSPNCPKHEKTIKVIVHHPMDWSPPKVPLERKSTASSDFCTAETNTPITPVFDIKNIMFEPDINICHDTVGSISTDTNVGSNVNRPSTEVPNISSIAPIAPAYDIKNIIFEPDINRCHDTVGSISTNTNDGSNVNISSAEIRNIDSIEVLGTVSGSGINDSDLNTSNEGPAHSSTLNSSQKKTANKKRSRKTSIGSFINRHKFLRDTMSVRTIHDSGVNISNEVPQSLLNSMPKTHSRFSLRLGNNMENLLEISASSAVDPSIYSAIDDDDDDDYDDGDSASCISY